jgi:quercetin dioxygenase-like cupin family protein
MALHHALPGQVIDVRPPAGSPASEMSTALFKAEQLEVLRLVLRAGQTWRAHQVPGEITVQCIEGVLELSTEGRVQVLQAGQLLYLGGDVRHGLTAREDACALVTICLHG